MSGGRWPQPPCPCQGPEKTASVPGAPPRARRLDHSMKTLTCRLRSLTWRRLNSGQQMAPLRNVDPQEQLDLLFRDVQRARDGVSAGQWEERARQFEGRLHRVIAESVLDDSLHSGSSGKHWSEATGLKVGDRKSVEQVNRVG